MNVNFFLILCLGVSVSSMQNIDFVRICHLPIHQAHAVSYNFLQINRIGAFISGKPIQYNPSSFLEQIVSTESTRSMARFNSLNSWAV